MKKLIYLSLLSFAVLAVSCTDRLDLAPLSAIGENGFYKNITEVEGAVIAIYDGLQDVPQREFALTEMRSDNTRTRSSEGDWAQFESFDVEPTNTAITSYWSANYNVIFRANRVLENLEVVNSANLKSQFEGEARFTRALAHFNLVQAFGDVPLIDKVIIQADSSYFDRDPVATVLSAIAADLSAARTLLPATMDYGRATSGAAAALLAKVMLTQGDYSGAEGVLNELTASGTYALEGSYRDVFFDEGNGEVIFAIPYLDDDANESQDFSFEMTAGGAISGLNYMTNEFLAAMDPTDSMRNDVLLSPAHPAETGKFTTQSADARLCGNDWIVLRYADVLLLQAEAIMAGATSTQDLDAIVAYNAVRERVNLSTLAVDGSETLTRDMLMNERRYELAFENHRFNDLVRFGVAEAVLSEFAANNNFPFTATDLLLPIPQIEINVSQGLLSQNPGY